MPNIRDIVKSMLVKYPRARNSDEYLFACILDHYFEWDVINFFMEWPAVQFINSMVRERRRFQMLWLYPAKADVREHRQRHSKYRANEHKATKKDIQKISIL